MSGTILWMRSGVPMIVPTVCRGFSDEYGSWKMIWTSRRNGSSSRSFSVAMSRPVELDLPEVGVLQPGHQPTGGRLAAAGLPDEAERLALVDGERDVVDGLDLADGARDDAAGAHREVLDQVLDLEQAGALRGGAPRPWPSAGSMPVTRPESAVRGATGVGGVLVGEDLLRVSPGGIG